MDRFEKLQTTNLGGPHPVLCKKLPMAHTASRSPSWVPEARLIIGESQLLNEIMPMIYKRFTEKAADEWRQIYKVGKSIDWL